MNVGLLVSGNLGYSILKNIFSDQEVKLFFVFTDQKSHSIISFCEENGIKTFVGNPRKGRASTFLSGFIKVELILSVNYLFLVEADVIGMASRFAINIHGSLLPKFRGRTPHVWAIINNEKVTGITAHLINEKCDEGDLILQQEISIPHEYSGQDLLDVFTVAYPVMVKEIIQKVKDNSIILTKQDPNKATFFEKRTAEDGKINFDWQKERIYNWVRALSDPYPGAFGFVKKTKIIIHKIEMTDFGFLQSMENGLVVFVENNSPYVKLQNGVIKIIKHVGIHQFKKGDVLA